MELLKKLFAIHSPSGNEIEMRKFIGKWVRKNVNGCKIKGDMYGNMYITKGSAKSYPCAVAHLDQVQREYPSDYQVVETEDIILAYSRKYREQCGLGADDKCGIWIALNLLTRYDAVKVAFFSGEEVGCQGSRRADMSFFDDTRFIIEADRRNAGDLITEIGCSPICSDEFIELIEPELFGYAPTSGLMTDVEALRDNGYPNCCINFSCGYYSPHTDHEIVNKNDLLNALYFACHIFNKVTEPMPYDQFYSQYDDIYYSEEDDTEYDLLCAMDYYYDTYKAMSPEEIASDLALWKPETSESELLRVAINWKKTIED